MVEMNESEALQRKGTERTSSWQLARQISYVGVNWRVEHSGSTSTHSR